MVKVPVPRQAPLCSARHRSIAAIEGNGTPASEPRNDLVPASSADGGEGGGSAGQGASILFTAFEPSGDLHAAPVIAALRELAPDLRIHAWGGPHMAEAGATVVEQTAGDGVIAVPSLRRIGAFFGELRRIETFAARERVALHVPVDSPAANFPIAKRLRRRGARVVHLVAPQFWAWGSWRKRKLQRLTSIVLCLLPFEEQWFRSRGILAKFVGHPVINRRLDRAALAAATSDLPRGSPRLLLLPGSRSREIERNMPLLLDAFGELQGRHRGIAGLVAAATPEQIPEIRRRHRNLPTGLHLVSGRLEEAIAWCDLAITVSGTVSLDVARQCKPMVGVYRTSPLGCLVAKVMLRVPDRLLPNILAGRRIVPEFVPHCGGAAAIVEAAAEQLADSRRLAETAEELRRVLAQFKGHDYAQESAREILRVLGRGG
jgi:lipid-A-disaccharide synthase